MKHLHGFSLRQQKYTSRPRNRKHFFSVTSFFFGTFGMSPAERSYPWMMTASPHARRLVAPWFDWGKPAPKFPMLSGGLTQRCHRQQTCDQSPPPPRLPRFHPLAPNTARRMTMRMNSTINTTNMAVK